MLNQLRCWRSKIAWNSSLLVGIIILTLPAKVSIIYKFKKTCNLYGAYESYTRLQNHLPVSNSILSIKGKLLVKTKLIPFIIVSKRTIFKGSNSDSFYCCVYLEVRNFGTPFQSINSLITTNNIVKVYNKSNVRI